MRHATTNAATTDDTAVALSYCDPIGAVAAQGQAWAWAAHCAAPSMDSVYSLQPSSQLRPNMTLLHTSSSNCGARLRWPYRLVRWSPLRMRSRLAVPQTERGRNSVWHCSSRNSSRPAGHLVQAQLRQPVKIPQDELLQQVWKAWDSKVRDHGRPPRPEVAVWYHAGQVSRGSSVPRRCQAARAARQVTEDHVRVRLLRRPTQGGAVFCHNEPEPRAATCGRSRQSRGSGTACSSRPNLKPGVDLNGKKQRASTSSFRWLYQDVLASLTQAVSL